MKKVLSLIVAAMFAAVSLPAVAQTKADEEKEGKAAKAQKKPAVKSAAKKADPAEKKAMQDDKKEGKAEKKAASK
jgi:hypothetical protein